MASTRNLFRWVLDSIADRGLSFRGNLSFSPMKRLCQDLASEPGEASGTAIAREIAERYAALGNGERLKFFEGLLDPIWLADAEQVLRSATQYSSQPTAAHLSKLFRLAEPKRQELFRRINMGPRGTATIVNISRRALSATTSNTSSRAASPCRTRWHGC